MHIDHHPLNAEFPEYREHIHTLKISNHHFSKLVERYEEIDKAVTRIENGVEHSADAHLEDLKKERLSLKDQLYHMLQSQAQANPSLN